MECVATMFNINYGYNKELLDKCRRLEEYTVFVATVRKNIKRYKDMDKAVDLAVTECIEKDILKDLLLKCRAEVKDMILTSFNQEEYEQTIRDESYNEGKTDGMVKGKEQFMTAVIKKKMEKGHTIEEIAGFLEVEKDEIRRLLEQETNKI